MRAKERFVQFNILMGDIQSPRFLESFKTEKDPFRITFKDGNSYTDTTINRLSKEDIKKFGEAIAISQLSSLVFLDFDLFKLDSERLVLLFNEISRAPHLEHLSFGGVSFASPGIHSFINALLNLKRLSFLELYNNEFDKVEIEVINKLNGALNHSTVSRLELGRPFRSEYFPEYFCSLFDGLTDIKELTLTEFPPHYYQDLAKTIESLKKLRQFNLVSIPIEKKSAEQFYNMLLRAPQVTSLFLKFANGPDPDSFPEMTTADFSELLKCLGKMKNLQTLELPNFWLDKERALPFRDFLNNSKVSSLTLDAPNLLRDDESIEIFSTILGRNSKLKYFSSKYLMDYLEDPQNFLQIWSGLTASPSIEHLDFSSKWRIDEKFIQEKFIPLLSNNISICEIDTDDFRLSIMVSSILQRNRKLQHLIHFIEKLFNAATVSENKIGSTLQILKNAIISFRDIVKNIILASQEEKNLISRLREAEEEICLIAAKVFSEYDKDFALKLWQEISPNSTFYIYARSQAYKLASKNDQEAALLVVIDLLLFSINPPGHLQFDKYLLVASGILGLDAEHEMLAAEQRTFLIRYVLLRALQNQLINLNDTLFEISIKDISAQSIGTVSGRLQNSLNEIFCFRIEQIKDDNFRKLFERIFHEDLSKQNQVNRWMLTKISAWLENDAPKIELNIWAINKIKSHIEVILASPDLITNSKYSNLPMVIMDLFSQSTGGLFAFLATKISQSELQNRQLFIQAISSKNLFLLPSVSSSVSLENK